MAVLRDANATAPVDANGVTSLSLSALTIGAGLTHSALIVQIGFSVGTVSVTSCQWDATGTPQDMTIITRSVASDTVSCELWGLIAPTAGNKTLTVKTGATTEIEINATSYKGVDPTGGDISFQSKQFAVGNSASTRVILPADNTSDMSVAVSNCGSSALSGTLQTELCNLSGAGSSNFASSEAAGSAGTVTHGWTVTSNPWSIVGVEIFNDLHPYITAQPQTIAVLVGATANFSVTTTASSGALSYQWKKNNVNDGSNSNTYSIGSVIASNNLTTVQVVVTDSNGSTTSNMVYLLVIDTATDWLHTA